MTAREQVDASDAVFGAGAEIMVLVGEEGGCFTVDVFGCRRGVRSIFNVDGVYSFEAGCGNRERIRFALCVYGIGNWR